MEDCIFCRIANREVGSEIVDERPNAIAFKDINPKAPVHILVIPKEHIASLDDLGRDECEVLRDIFSLASDIAVSEGIAQSGYRVVLNIGEEAGQEVDHLHFHLLGGRFMEWPPG
ncbi:MAG: histidine triad nucleotide-binding protein [Actinobacteria bacterium]|nr:histidine triad nucleotide-binding protein [Actinomycetota bacterium]MBU4302319.1 histidine triad nucleotide-binding protein [Actinomycetota bacterium]MBU4401928.1 histidine triad nucleotide-binding protein [Actinomycetota bacterium]MBU4490098.1 histidine triad nucleotide-binding protein [Actinomycetota bacterium]MCG2794315.1 histidine triad nucleotide-binding protein [Actinomycetes bacterium]